MAIQMGVVPLRTGHCDQLVSCVQTPASASLSSSSTCLPLRTSSPTSLFLNKNCFKRLISHEGFDSHSFIFTTRVTGRRSKGPGNGIVASSNAATPSIWDDWKPVKGSSSLSLSDIVWPSAGAFAAMAVLGKMDQLLAPKGLSMTIAPLGAVCAVLLATPSAPAARKYNMFMAQIGCAAIGVLAFLMLGPGWLARSFSLSACIAYMIYTGSVHPPAASLPILFIDGVKLHHLSLWYTFFPGAAGCILISLIQEMVLYLKENFKF